MPKLIVYVPASTWRLLEAKEGQDAAVLARALARESIEEYVLGAGPREHEGTGEEMTAIELPPDGTEIALEGSKKRPRAHPCKHHFPPSKHCTFGCDD